MRVKISLYPNNELRMGVTNDSPLKKNKDKGENDSHSFFVENDNDSQGATAKCAKSVSTPPLDIRSEVETRKAGFGGLPRRTVFGLRAKRTIQRVGGVFDRLFRPEECVFLTGTLPGSTDESLRAIACWSGYIVHRLKAWINKYEPGKYDFYCWEWQQRGALHLHYAVYVHSPSNRELLIKRFRYQWVRLIKSVGEFAGVDMFNTGRGFSHLPTSPKIQAYAQTVNKSVAAYLSKYCSKGHATSESHYCPSRWWGVSNACRRALEEMTETVTIECLSRNQAEKMYEEVMSITDVLSIKRYTYRHGSGFGRSIVTYHCPQDSPQDIWQTLLSKLSMQFTSVFMGRTSNSLSVQNRHALRYWALSLESRTYSLSAPLKAKILKEGFTTKAGESLSISDWREFYSIACLMLKDSSLNSASMTIKRMALREIRYAQHR